MKQPPRSRRALPLQGALTASGQPLSRHEQSPGQFASGLTPKGTVSLFGTTGRN